MGKIERKAYLSNFKIDIEKTIKANDIVNSSIILSELENFILTNQSITNYVYSFKVEYYSKIFKNSDIYKVFIDTNQILFENSFVKNITMSESGSPFGIITTDTNKFNNIYNVKYILKLKFKIINQYLIYLIILIIIKYFIYKSQYKKIAIETTIIFLFNLFLYLISNSIIMPYFSMIKLKISIYDILYSFIVSMLAYNLIYNKKLILTIVFNISIIFYLFSLQTIGLTIKNTPLFYGDIFFVYPTLLTILPTYMKVITISVTILYTAVTIFFNYIFIKNIIKIIKIKSKKIVTIFIIIGIISISIIINYIVSNISDWEINHIKYANEYGIINTMISKIKIDNNLSVKISRKNVEESLNLLLEYQNKRNIDNLLLSKATTNNIEKRDIFILILESFYDYSHFTNLFDKDPFSKEYRQWANNSSRLFGHTYYGSFVARFTATTGAISSVFPKTQKELVENTLPDLLLKNGYNTIALEEADVTYNLNTFYPSIGINDPYFKIGAANLNNFIKNNINSYKKPFFILAFTFIGHTGTEYLVQNIDKNTKSFIKYFKNTNEIDQTLKLSILQSEEIIKIKNTILSNSPNALIICFNDHFYPFLKNAIETSSINKTMKENFLKDNAPMPILIWDGTNGAVKPTDIFVRENIPLFIAVNNGINYTNSIISLMYREKIDNTIHSYDQYYKGVNSIYPTNNNNLIKYTEAQNILSKDIFLGKNYYKTIINQKEEIKK